MTRAIIVYLRYRRDEVDADPVDLLRLAARAEYGDAPPDALSRWLEQRGVTL
jgi:hypothetical protein